MNSNALTYEDIKEAGKLQKRQQFEDERKKRIFNAKRRLFGVSYIQIYIAVLFDIHASYIHIYKP